MKIKRIIFYLCIAVLFGNDILPADDFTYQTKMIFEVTLTSGRTLALDSIKEHGNNYHAIFSNDNGSIMFIYAKSAVKSIEKKLVLFCNSTTEGSKDSRFVSEKTNSGPEGQNSRSNTSVSKKLLPPLCYVSETGSRYHSIRNCSVTEGARLLTPVYSLDGLKKNMQPCKNCWGNRNPLF